MIYRLQTNHDRNGQLGIGLSSFDGGQHTHCLAGHRSLYLCPAPFIEGISVTGIERLGRRTIDEIKSHLSSMTACSLLVLFAVVMLGQSKAVSTEHRRSVDVSVTQAELDEPAACSGAFVAHDLDFVTGARVRDITTYLSNGAGVAANDLDGDGDLDLVFASVDRESEILWNLGDLSL